MVASPDAASLLAWRPELAFTQPWRWITAAWVHWSSGHLLANLAGTALVAALGLTLALPPRSAVAWALAWPLTHLALLLRPELQAYGGASGVLHAGVAVAAVALCARMQDRRRWLGLVVLAGLALKVLSEQPWGPVLQQRAGWNVPIAPLAHATGALAGLLCALAAEALARRGHNAPR
jgi:rhomboid family GlyGly-CTERM serine protease